MRKDMEYHSPVLGPKDQKDFEKYLKFLCLKAVQVIVQSRNGEKGRTSSKPPAIGQHWFNLAIDDMPEITSETKKSLGGCLPSKEQPMCIEISLKTSEGESMVLETWCLGMNNRQDSHAKITFTVYNRMGMLLKSLVAVTRVTPAYRLARKQGIDYDICYRVYFGDVRVNELGVGFQTMHVGSVGTPVGSVTLSAAYRTNLSMTERQAAMPVKSDHYSYQDYSNQGREASRETPIRCAPGTQAQLHVGAGVRHVAEEIANAFETEVTSSGRTKGNSKLSNHRSPPQRSHSKGTSTPRPFSITTGHHTKGAFASSPVSADVPSLPALSSTPPFASLLIHGNGLGSRPDTPETATKLAHRNNMSSSNRKDSSSESVESRQPPSNFAPSLWGGDDDFVLVELKPAFATPSSADGDIGSFYRECQTAPSLTLFEEAKDQTMDSIMDSSSESVESRQPPSNVAPSLWGGDDDFVLVELKPAFATPSSADGDIGSFYRECQTAPSLTLFEEAKDQTMDSIMNDLDRQLSTYNECMPMFDELVANLKSSQLSGHT